MKRLCLGEGVAIPRVCGLEILDVSLLNVKQYTFPKDIMHAPCIISDVLF